MTTKIGILGASFDPPHLAHLALAKTALETFNFREILMLLTPNPPHKQDRQLTNFALRRQMLELLIKGEKKLTLCDVENERKGPHYTIDTVRILKKRMPDIDEFWLVVGSDTLRNLHTWHKAEQLLREVKICVAFRPGFDFGALKELKKITSRETFDEIIKNVVPLPALDISSTKIRQHIKDGLPVDNLTSREVIEFITAHKLYRD